MWNTLLVLFFVHAIAFAILLAHTSPLHHYFEASVTGGIFMGLLAAGIFLRIALGGYDADLSISVFLTFATLDFLAAAFLRWRFGPFYQTN